ncbi:MAG TPA: hypothetical protein VGF22_20385 [Acidimicrobiales bacterium]|jgi:hypothetical protein
MTTSQPNQQLTLIEPAGVPAQLQLDERTRRVGLAGVAQARAILAESRRQRLAREAEAAEARRPGRAA